MSKLIDLTGERFGRLTVIKQTENDKPYGTKWLCKCDCGNEVIVFSNNLRRGNTRSCGCLKLENQTTHDLWGTPIYRAWDNMRNRCYNKHYPGFKNWGGRGIIVCDEWKENFQLFYEYVSKLEHYGEPGRSLDRIDNDGNYEPGNVRWATRKEQTMNRRCMKKRLEQFGVEV